MAYDVVDMEDIVDDLGNQVDEIDEDLAEVEEEVYGGEYSDDRYDDDDDDFDDFKDDEAYYEITCPACNETTIVDEDALIEGGLDCPYCGAEIEFDFSELNEDVDALEGAEGQV